MSDLNSMLLKVLANSGQEGGVSAQEMLLSQLGEQDPNLAMLAQFLSGSSEDEELEDEVFDDQDLENEADQQRILVREYEAQSKTLATYAEKYNHLSAITRQLHHKLKDIYAELEELRERNDLLAEALGACHLCWGEDIDCEICRGEGYPGFFKPDANMFRQYVTPATQRLQRQARRKQQDAEICM